MQTPQIAQRISFVSHWMSHELRNSEDWLNGKSSFVHSGDAGTILKIDKHGCAKTKTREAREPRYLVRMDNGTYCWADASLVELSLSPASQLA